MAYRDEEIEQVGTLVRQGVDSATICRLTAQMGMNDGRGISSRTLRNWKRDNGWKSIIGDPFAAMEIKLATLMELQEPTEREIQLIEVYSNTLIKRQVAAEDLELKKLLQKILTKERGPTDAGTASGSRKGKGRGRKNDFTGIDVDQVEKGLPDDFFHAYQWAYKNDKSLKRYVLKSRRIGFSFIIAWEALTRGIQLGRDQIFISATKRQAGIIRKHIKYFAQKIFHVKLTGTDEITATSDAGSWSFHFLAANASSVVGYGGDLYFDEFARIHNLEEILKEARPIAEEIGFRTTYCTNPSIKSHYSYRIWKGLDREGQEIPKDRDGNPEDGLKRFVFDLNTAVELGCQHLDPQKIAEDYDDIEYKQLFGCIWLDAQDSYFKLAALKKCQVKGRLKQIGGSNLVMVGYDSSRTGDDASIVVVEYDTERGKLRLIHRESYSNLTFKGQGREIKRLVRRYGAFYVGIDITGNGRAVFEEIEALKEEGVTIQPFVYNIQVKNDLIVNMRRIVEENILLYSADDTEITESFLTIHQVATTTGDITFRASRTATTGHADVVFALCHACKGIDFGKKPRKGIRRGPPRRGNIKRAAIRPTFQPHRRAA